MTTAIEVTKREMYHAIAGMKGRIEINYSVKDMLSGVDNVEHALEAHLEAQRQDRAALTTERDTLRNRVQVLEMANATSGEVIRSLKREAEQARKALMVARLTEFAAQVSGEQENVASATLDTKPRYFYGMSDSEVGEIISGMAKIARRITRQAADMRCMHSFHPAFPSGELCTFCGVGK